MSSKPVTCSTTREFSKSTIESVQNLDTFNFVWTAGPLALCGHVWIYQKDLTTSPHVIDPTGSKLAENQLDLSRSTKLCITALLSVYDKIPRAHNQDGRSSRCNYVSRDSVVFPLICPLYAEVTSLENLSFSSPYYYHKCRSQAWMRFRIPFHGNTL